MMSERFNRPFLALKTEEGAVSQGLWATSEIGKGTAVDCVKSMERNAALETLILGPLTLRTER